MGGAFSSAATTTESNPNNSDSPTSSSNSSGPTMSSSDPKTPLPVEDQASKEAVDSLISIKTLEESDQSKIPYNQDGDVNQEGEEEEEEGECGFCLFMKGGGCKDAFIAWEDCIKETEKKNEDIVEKCFEATSALKMCMEAHANYYEPILKAEKAAEEEAVIELEKEKAANESKKNENSR